MTISAVLEVAVEAAAELVAPTTIVLRGVDAVGELSEEP